MNPAATHQLELGRANLERVRTYFSEHLCATNRECARALGLGVMAVGRHVKAIREEWVGRPYCIDTRTGHDIFRDIGDLSGEWSEPKSF